MSMHQHKNGFQQLSQSENSKEFNKLENEYSETNLEAGIKESNLSLLKHNHVNNYDSNQNTNRSSVKCILSAVFYGLSSIFIVFINKILLTNLG